MNIDTLLRRLNLDLFPFHGSDLPARSPIDGQTISTLRADRHEEVDHKIKAAHQAYLEWRMLPPPKRGELIRLFAEELRAHKAALGELVSIEAGKIRQEGLGEVQEMIDICDFAVGLSRQLYGLTIASERAGHRMMETWHPLGVCGIISAFNFPVAVWSWNAALALVCGDAIVWKPSEKAPLTALACQHLLEKAMRRFGSAPEGLSQVILGDRRQGAMLVDHHLVPLISATGSVAMGRAIGARAAQRFARTILELGGNNAMLVTPSADVELALRAITFAAVGTAGQRCTSLRRLFIHESVYDTLISRLKSAYKKIVVGDPLDPQTLVGPLIDQAAFATMQQALLEAQQQGGVLFGGERVQLTHYPNGCYVRPALVEMATPSAVMQQETFAPILYVLKYRELGQAIAWHNAVPQGLSSAIFTNDMREAELFLSAAGSDCGIANVNIGTSGAEIGGAFGGEKETGGGRESGSDSWKAYMRRATNTINYSRELPLAQGIQFDL